MRLLISVHGAWGHFHPMAAIGAAARDAGHDVAFATEPTFVPAIERAGFMAIPMGMVFDPADASASFPELATLTGFAGMTWAIEHVFFGALAEAALDDADRIVAEWRPDLVLNEVSECASRLAAERRDVDRATFNFGGLDLGLLDAVAGNAWNRLRATVGLPSDPGCASLRTHPLIAAMPASWAGDPVDDPYTRVQLPLFDETDGVGLPAWVAGFGPRPVVYATLGTAFNATPGVLEAMVAALDTCAVPAIVTTGRGVDRERLGRTVATVRVEEYIPQSLLLPHVDAVVHHGGFSTVLGAIRHGLPQVVIPLGADQPINAAQVEALGLGIVVPEDRRTAEAIGAAIDEVLSDDGYRRRAEELRTDTEALPTLDVVVAGLAARSA